MQQFLVPQFIDVEAKVIGPVTVRQFIIMMFCLGVLVIEYKLVDFELFLLIGVITLAIFAVLAFLKINGRPFHYFLLVLFQTLKSPRLRVWNKELPDKDLKKVLKSRKEPLASIEPRPFTKRVHRSRLSELTLIVNTGGSYRSEGEPFAPWYEEHGKNSANNDSQT